MNIANLPEEHFIVFALWEDGTWITLETLHDNFADAFDTWVNQERDARIMRTDGRDMTSDAFDKYLAEVLPDEVAFGDRAADWLWDAAERERDEIEAEGIAEGKHRQAYAAE